jgi:hypothetical protein
MVRPAGGRGQGSEGRVDWMKALVLIAVLVVVGVVILARSGSGTSKVATGGHRGTAAASTTTLAPSTTTTSVLPASQVKVQVLNGIGSGSYAGQWSTKLATKGYVTEKPDDATTRVPTSIIFILTPGYQAEANQLAATVGLSESAVDPTIPPPSSAPIPATERNTANLVLVIGPDLQGSA